MMQKFRICAGAVKVWSAQLLIGFLLVEVIGGTSRVSRRSAATQSAGALMLGTMASQWKPLQWLGQTAENLVFREGPKFIRQQLTSPVVQRGIQQGLKAGIDVLAG